MELIINNEKPVLKVEPLHFVHMRNEDISYTLEDGSLMNNKFIMGDIVVTDPNAALISNDITIPLPLGLISLSMHGIVFQSWRLRHEGGCEAHTSLTDMIDRIDDITSYTQTINDVEYIVTQGMMDTLDNMRHHLKPLLIEGSYEPHMEDTGLCSGYLYSWNVADIRNDPEFQKLANDWTRDLIFDTAPPCITVIVHESQLAALQKWLYRTHEVKFTATPTMRDVTTPEQKMREQLASLETSREHIERYIRDGVFRWHNMGG